MSGFLTVNADDGLSVTVSYDLNLGDDKQREKNNGRAKK